MRHFFDIVLFQSSVLLLLLFVSFVLLLLSICVDKKEEKFV